VVQPVRLLHGVPVIFGLGNFVSNMTDTATRDGVIARVRATREVADDQAVAPWRFDISLIPTWVDPSSFIIRPVVVTLDQPGGSSADAELRASWQRTIDVMSADGVARPGPMPPTT